MNLKPEEFNNYHIQCSLYDSKDREEDNHINKIYDLIKSQNKRKNVKIVDLGCGKEIKLYKKFINEEEYEVTNIDVTDVYEDKITVRDISNLYDIKNKTYDFVVLSRALWGYPNYYKRTLNEASRILKDGGKFIFADFYGA